MSDRDTSLDMRKLAALLPHLLKHNDEHARELEKWANRAQQCGCTDVAAELEKASRLLENVGDHMRAAGDKINTPTPVSGDHPSAHP